MLKNLKTCVANCCEDREDVIHNNIETRDRLLFGAKNKSNALHPTDFSNNCSQYLIHRFKIFSSMIILKNVKLCNYLTKIYIQKLRILIFFFFINDVLIVLMY